MTRCLRPVLALGILAGCGSTTPLAATPPGAAPTETPSPIAIGVIQGQTLEQAKNATFAWLRTRSPAEAVLQRAEALWDPAVDRPVVDRVAETVALVDAEAARFIAAAQGQQPGVDLAAAPVLRDQSRPAFVRANVGLYAAKVASLRRLHEDALAVLRAVQPEQVVDPASYYFYRAVCENKLLMKEEGLLSVHRLLNSVTDAPERYVVLAGLMQAEMERWQDKDLGDVARRMEEIEGRLANARGGPKTQEKQKEVVALLDKMIEDLEKQC